MFAFRCRPAVVLLCSLLPLAAAVTVGVSPTTAVVAQGTTKQFSATVSGSTNTGVTWSLPGGSAAGTISSTGLYMAPATAGTYKVRARSKASTSVYTEATVTVPMKVALTPATATLNQGATQAFSATVTGSATKTLTWAVTGGSANGTVTSAGLYTAPAKAGTYSVTATTVATPSATATATITVNAVAIALSPASASLAPGATKTFAATVTGTTNTSVTWAVTGGSTNGTITSAGVYTAPATAGTYTVVATSAADPTKTASATVTVSAPAVAVSVSPTTTTMAQGATQTFAATVTGTTNTAVTWSVPGGAANGSITTGGLYTAPAKAGTYSVTATTVATPSATATATITVNAVALALSPTSASLAPGATKTFAATVTGTTNTSVTWAVTGGSTNGTITSAGVYTAPATAGTYTVVATSAADPTKTASATVTVSAGVSVSISPTTVTLTPGASQLFTATVTGATDTSTNWTYSGGTLAQQGGGMLFTAGSTPGTYTLTVASKADPNAKASATITLTPGVAVSVSPASPTLLVNGTQTFTASVTGTTNTAVTWSASAGTITPGGVYTAPATAGSATVTATSQADGTKKASVPVTVVAALPTQVLANPGFEAGATGWTASNAEIFTQDATKAHGGAWVAWLCGYGTATVDTLKQQAILPANATAATLTFWMRISTVETGTTAKDVLKVQVRDASNAVLATLATYSNLDAGSWVQKTFDLKAFAGQAVQVYLEGSEDAQNATHFFVDDFALNVTAAPQPVAISVTPTTASLAPGGTQAFTATVTGSTNAGATWSVVGGAANGTITSGGVYTAPATPGTYTVVATAAADTSKTASATLTVNSPGVAVAITPAAPTVAQGAIQAFAATVTGTTNSAVTWSVTGGAANGTITSAGAYTAPATSGTYTVVATSVADASRNASAPVTVPALVAVTPATATLDQGATQPLAAAVTGSTNQVVTWSVTGGSANGTVTSAGLYTAPAKAGTYTVTATTAATPAGSSSATITVNAVGLTVSPSIASLGFGVSQTFTATVAGTTNKAVTWAVTGGSANGTITSAGVYTAPATAGTYTVVATSAADPSKTANLTVTVAAGPLTLTPTSVTLIQGSKQEFRTNQPVSWALSAGSLSYSDTMATYTAAVNGNDLAVGTYTVTATSKADASQKVTAAILVKRAVTVLPDAPSVHPGSTQRFTSSVMGLASTDVTWAATSGSITNTGLWTAPSTTGSATITATSVSDPTKSGSTTANVTNGPIIVSLRLDKASYKAGERATVYWETQYASTVTVNVGSGAPVVLDSPTTTGSKSFIVTDDQAPSALGERDVLCRLGADSDQGSTQTQLTFHLSSPYGALVPIKPMIGPGQGTTLSVGIRNGVGKLSPGQIAVIDGQQVPVQPDGYTTYTLTVTNDLGASCQAQSGVSVTDASAELKATAGASPIKQYGQTSTLLLDGRVLLAGGQLWGETKATAKAQIFDPRTGLFTSVSNMGNGRNKHSATLLPNGNVLLMGGGDNSNLVSTGELFDPTSGTFTKFGDMNRLYHSATLLNDGRILIAGGNVGPRDVSSGCQAALPTERCLLLNPSTGEITRTGAMNWVKGQNVGLLLPSGKVLISAIGQFSTGVELYDPMGGYFTLLSATERGALSRLNDGRILVGVRIFNPQTETFEGSFDVPYLSENTGLSLPDGRTVHYSAFGLPEGAGSFLLGDPKTLRSFQILAPMPDPHAFLDFSSPGIATMLPDGKALFVGDMSGNTSPFLLDGRSTLVVQPALGMVKQGETVVFTTSGTNSTGALSWSATEGTVDGTGRWTVPSKAGVYKISASPASAPNTTAVSWMMVAPIQVRIQGSRSLRIAKKASLTFVAQVTHANPSVTWSIEEGEAGGTITAQGLYTAGTTGGHFTIVATSVADPNVQDRVNVDVDVDSAPSILSFRADRLVVAAGVDPLTLSWNAKGDISGSSITPVGGASQFINDPRQSSLTVWPTATPVDSPDGSYIPKTTLAYDLVVNPGSSWTTSARVALLLVDPRAIRIAPRQITLLPGESYALRAVFDASSRPAGAVTWSTTGGAITPEGLFTAPPDAGTVTITATNREMPALTDSISITVGAVAGPPVIDGLQNPAHRAAVRGSSFSLGWMRPSNYTRLWVTASTGEQWDATSLPYANLQLLTLPPVSANTTYTLHASNPWGETAASTTVVVGDTVALAPDTVYLRPGSSFAFQFTGGNGSNLEFTTTGGAFPYGLYGEYVAPATPGAYQVTLRRKDLPDVSATANVVVGDGPTSRLQIQPASAAIPVGQQFRFGAQWVSPYSSGLTWAASGGSVDGAGLYTPPTTPGTYQVTVTDTNLNPPATSTATILVTPPVAPDPGPSDPDNPTPDPAPISIRPAVATALPGGRVVFGFTAAVPQVTWSATGGVISNGVYTAPTAPGAYEVTVSTPSGQRATATVTVKLAASPASPPVEITPMRALLKTGQTLRFSTRWARGTFTWSLIGSGVLTADGIYTAPQNATTAIEYVTVTCDDGQGGSSHSTAEIIVEADPVPALTPTDVVLGPGQTFQFQARTGGRPVKWGSSSPYDSIQPTGLFTAPPQPGIYQVSLQDLEFPSRVAMATVEVRELAISPTRIALAPGKAFKFRALTSLAGTLAWSASKGSVQPDGTYTAPSGLGPDTVTVGIVPPGSTAPPTVTATAQVDVRADIATIVSFTVDKSLIKQGETATLSWEALNALSTTLTGVGAGPVNVPTKGTQAVTPGDTATYTLSVSNVGGGETATVKVRVQSDLHWKSDRIYGFGHLLSEDRLQADGKVRVLYVQGDQVGSPNFQTDEAGQVVGRSKNLPFGERYGAEGEQSFERFAGHEDGEGSAIYMQARMMLPAYGVFASPDPHYDSVSWDPNSYNLFLYVGANPVTRMDLTGESWRDVWNYTKGVGEALGGVAVGVGKGALGMAKGIGHMVAHPVDTAVGLGKVVAHPVMTAKAIGKQISNAVENANSNYEMGQLVGEALFGIGTAAAPFAKAGQVAALTEGAEAAVNAAKAGEAAEAVEAGEILAEATGSGTVETTQSVEKTLTIPSTMEEELAAYRTAAREGKLVRTRSSDLPRSKARKIWEAENGEVPEGYDVDHIVQRQHGGTDEISNLQLKQSGINRSEGPKARGLMGDDSYGTKYTDVKLKE